MEPKYKRIILKISGEALAGTTVSALMPIRLKKYQNRLKTFTN